MDAIVQRTLKFVAFNGKDEPDISGKDAMKSVIPPTPVLWRKAAEIYWEEKSEQLSCELDSSLPVPACMEDLVGAYIYLDDPPFAALGQLPISIASSSDERVLMPKETEMADQFWLEEQEKERGHLNKKRNKAIRRVSPGSLFLPSICRHSTEELKRTPSSLPKFILNCTPYSYFSLLVRYKRL
jgi:hypothetical protein